MNNELMDKYLKSVLTTGDKINSLDYIRLGIMEEFGEIVGKIKRYRRGDYQKEEFKTNMKKELGDLTWYLVLYQHKNGVTKPGFRAPRNTRIMTNINTLELLKGHLAVAKMPKHKSLIVSTMIDTVTDLAWNFGLTMEDVCNYNMKKTQDRLFRNMIKGQGDER